MSKIIPPKNGMRKIHPGEILREEFLVPMGLSHAEFAKKACLSQRYLEEIVNEKRSINPLIAKRLSKGFGTSMGFWIGLQESYDEEWHSKK